MNLLILGYIRPEYDYVDREALIADIRTDVEVAKRSLEREGYWWGRFVGGETKGEGEEKMEGGWLLEF